MRFSLKAGVCGQQSRLADFTVCNPGLNGGLALPVFQLEVWLSPQPVCRPVSLHSENIHALPQRSEDQVRSY